MALPKKVLEELGLSDKEAKVYLSLLELGASPVQKIASKAGVNRATTYVCLEALLKLGLVSTVQKGVKTYFAPEHPEQLMALINKQEKEIERKKEELEGVIANLKSAFETAGDRPIVRFYEGKEGIRAMAEDQKSGVKLKDKESYGFAPLDKYFEYANKNKLNPVSKRIEKKIKANTIYNFSSGPRPDAKSKKELRDAVWVDQNKYPIYTDFYVLGSKISFMNYSENPIGIIIENKEIAETFRSVFKLAKEAAEAHEKEYLKKNSKK